MHLCVCVCVCECECDSVCDYYHWTKVAQLCQLIHLLVYDVHTHTL